MKNLIARLALTATVCNLLISIQPLLAQGTAFTYQGQLSAGGSPASGNYNMIFALYPTNVGGAVAAGPLTNTAIAVNNGLFTTTLDFGLGVFNGSNYWLDISVQTNGGNGFTELMPRQEITPSPYAIYAPNAGVAANTTGAITVAQLPAAVLTNNDTNVNLTGIFNGNGGGLTNISSSNLAGTLADSQLPTNVVTVTGEQGAQADVYASAGINTVVVPAGASQMTAKLWGAGGGGANSGNGGGGAFVQTTLNVVPGQTFTIVVGQHGDAIDNNAGGNGSGDAQGGEGNLTISANENINGGQGGQASSLFNFTNGNYVMEAVAGGGGGAGAGANGGAGGNPGAAGVLGPQSDLTAADGGNNGAGGNGGTSSGFLGNFPGGSGSSYAANATSVGLASPSAAGGNGGNGNTSVSGGGGGGGYGGGGGGTADSGGGGGGSYGEIILGGNNAVAGNTNDPNYLSSNGNGGASGNGNNPGNGQDGLAVIIFGFGSANVSGTVQANGFIGNGSGLTDLPAASLTGTISSAQLPANLVPLTINNGGALTNLNAADLTSTVPLSALPANLVPLAANNGGALTNLQFTNLAGTIPLSSLPNLNLTNIATNLPVNYNYHITGNTTNGGDTSGGYAAASILIENTNATVYCGPALRVQADGSSTTNAALSVSSQNNSSGSLIAQFGNATAFVANVDVNGDFNGHAFNTISDRNAKENFAPLDPRTVLDKVAALPVTEWNFKDAALGVRHIGPMAQDFHAAFGLNGSDDRHISLSDEGGVALAAIQALNQKLEQQGRDKDAEIQTLQRQNESLARRLNELATTVKALQK